MSDSRKYHVAELTTEEPSKGVNIKMIVAVGAIAMVVFMFSAFIAWKILVGDVARIEAAGVANPAPLQGQKEINIVDSVQFTEDDRLLLWRAQMHERLTGYSWADKTAGRVRLPITVGMKKAMAEAAAGTAVGEANAVVTHEPEVPRLKLNEVIVNPAGKPPGEGPITGSHATPVARPADERGPDKDPKPPGGGIK